MAEEKNGKAGHGGKDGVAGGEGGDQGGCGGGGGGEEDGQCVCWRSFNEGGGEEVKF